MTVKFRGVAIEWEDKGSFLIVPPLTVGQMEEVEAMIEAHDAVTLKTTKDIQTRLKLKIPIVHKALLRNYPDITEGDVKDLLNGFNADSALYAALGLERWNPKIKNVGEASPVLNQPPTLAGV